MKLKQKISLTGYRLLFILQLLTQGAVSKEEILEFISSQKDLQEIGYDTLRLDLNTLEAAGFNIKTEYAKGEYKYLLKWFAMGISFSKEELRALNGLKNALMEVCDWRYIVSLYGAFKDIARLMSDEDAASELLNFGYFLSVDLDLLEELACYCRQNNEIKILYASPESVEKEMSVRCLDIEYNKETKKLYFWCKISSYEGLSYLRAERVLKIVEVKNAEKSSIQIPKLDTCRYKVHKNSHFQLGFSERVVKIEKDFIEVEADVMSDFHFVQKILLLGENCFWVEREDLKKLIVQKLLNLKRNYEVKK